MNTYTFSLKTNDIIFYAKVEADNMQESLEFLEQFKEYIPIDDAHCKCEGESKKDFKVISEYSYERK